MNLNPRPIATAVLRLRALRPAAFAAGALALVALWPSMRSEVPQVPDARPRAVSVPTAVRAAGTAPAVVRERGRSRLGGEGSGSGRRSRRPGRRGGDRQGGDADRRRAPAAPVEATVTAAPASPVSSPAAAAREFGWP